MFSVLIYICRPKLESLCHIRADTGKHGDQTKNGTEETTGPGGNVVNVFKKICMMMEYLLPKAPLLNMS